MLTAARFSVPPLEPAPGFTRPTAKAPPAPPGLQTKFVNCDRSQTMPPLVVPIVATWPYISPARNCSVRAKISRPPINLPRPARFLPRTPPQPNCPAMLRVTNASRDCNGKQLLRCVPMPRLLIAPPCNIHRRIRTAYLSKPYIVYCCWVCSTGANKRTSSGATTPTGSMMAF